MIKQSIFIRGIFVKQTWSRLIFYVLGPENSDSPSKTTRIVSFPGLNSYFQVKIPLTFFCFFYDSFLLLIGSSCYLEPHTFQQVRTKSLSCLSIPFKGNITTSIRGSFFLPPTAYKFFGREEGSQLDGEVWQDVRIYMGHFALRVAPKRVNRKFLIRITKHKKKLKTTKNT